MLLNASGGNSNFHDQIFWKAGCWLGQITQRSLWRAPITFQLGGSRVATGQKYQTHIDFLIAFRNIGKEQTSRSCPSHLAAPLTLRS
jgi:hypothetical protein